MAGDNLKEKRAALQRLLDQIDQGNIAHYDEDETGRLRRVTTTDERERIQLRIADLDKRIGEADA
jgi:uncharacterized protein YlxP (DUF503 family)